MIVLIDSADFLYNSRKQVIATTKSMVSRRHASVSQAIVEGHVCPDTWHA